MSRRNVHAPGCLASILVGGVLVILVLWAVASLTYVQNGPW